ncbi:uncharacterized protein [Clytia hemisphaerica]|uniref:uncharacterized protein n=1 Tax=Clytia hemisphaerica TaxID=252671 RepID=UPI0034D4798D
MAKQTDLFLSHNWGKGQSNHEKVANINEELVKVGYVTWFDEYDMTGNVREKMAEGIENTKCFVVFLTKEYMKKVTHGATNDNCKAEFDYASTLNIPKICVILDPSVRSTSQWKGNIGLTLKKYIYVNMSENVDDPVYLSNQVKLLTRELESRGIFPKQTVSSNEDVKKQNTPTSKPKIKLELEKISPNSIAFSINQKSVKRIKHAECSVEGKENYHETLSSQKYQLALRDDILWLQIEMDMMTGFNYFFDLIFVDKEDTDERIQYAVQLEGKNSCTVMDANCKESGVLVFAHESGTSKSIHSYKVQQHIRDEDQCKSITTGPSVITTVGQFHQRARQYYIDHLYTNSFPPAFYLKDEIYKTLTEKLRKYVFFKNAKIINGYNYRAHLEMFGLTGDQCSDIVKITLNGIEILIAANTENNVLFVFGVNEEPLKVHKDLSNLNDVLRVLYHISYGLIQKECIGLVGILVCPKLSNDDIKNHPALSIDPSSKMLFLTSEHFQNERMFTTWINKLVKIVLDYMREIRNKSDVAVKEENFEILLGGIMASSAQTSLCLPRMTSDQTTKVKYQFNYFLATNL